VFDLHVHTKYSRDAHCSPEDLAKHLQQHGFSGMAITDHNTTKGAFRKYKLIDFLIIPGIEISTERGHLLGIGIQTPITSTKAAEAVDDIHDAGGVAILPHPGRLFSGAMRRYDSLKIDAIEIMNGRSFPAQNRMAAAISHQLDRGTTGGSDAHFLWEVGSAYTLSEATTVDELMTAIRKKRTTTGGTSSLLRPLHAASKAMFRYVSDGFSKI
jgi:predicted metal-dependent phosphoesterase TrpH